MIKAAYKLSLLFLPFLPFTAQGQTTYGVTTTADGTLAKPTTFWTANSVVRTTGSYANPSWITGLAWDKITGEPTTLAGYGIADAQPLDSDLTTWAAITPGSNWAALLAAAKPSTLAGYGIADAQPLDSDLTSISALATTAFGRGFLDLADEASARTKIGTSTIDNGQFYSAAKIAAWSNVGAAPLRILYWGDSLSSGLREGANMARQGSTLGVLSSTGTVTTLTGRTDLWINGLLTEMAAGSTTTWNSGLANDPVFNRVQILYLAQSGAGTVSVDYSGNAGSSWVNITSFSASNATTIGASQIITVPSDYTLPRRRIRLSVSSGTVRIIGVIGYNSNGIGVISMQNLFNGTGHDAVQELDTPNAIVQPIWEALAVDCAVVCWADEASTYETGGGFRQMYEKLVGWRAATDFILVAPNPAGVDDSLRVASSKALYAFAREKGQSFFDGYSLFRSYSQAATAGFYNHPSDQVHLTSVGNVFRNYALWTQMSLGNMPLGAVSVGGVPQFWTSLNDSASTTNLSTTPDATGFGRLVSPRSFVVRQAGGETAASGTSGISVNDSLSTYAGNDGFNWTFWSSNAIGRLSAFGIDFLSMDANGSGLGGGTKRVYSPYPIESPGFRISSSTTASSITADDQSLSITDLSFIRLSSDSVTATDRTFTITNGLRGQILVLKWTHATNRAELADSGNCLLNAAWTPDQDDTITLIWDGSESKWTELQRSQN